MTSIILPAATGATVRAGIGADERDGSGAVLDIVTRAGGRSLRGLVDVAGGGRAWSRDTLPEATLAANPRLADRDRIGRSLRVATVVSGPLTPHVGFGLAAELADETRADALAAVTRTPRVHGRLGWASGPRAANVVGFVDRRATTGDVPYAMRPFAAPGVDNERTSHTIATRTTWQGPLRGAMNVSASVDLLRGSRTTRPASDAAARQDDVTGAVTGSLGLVQQDRRTRTIVGGAVDWRTPAMGGHDLRIGIDLERTQVTERASFTGGEFFHDLAGRPDTVDVWDGDDRQTHLGREALFITDTWTPGRRVAIVAGLRAARLHGGAYAATSVQPRVGATVAVDRGARLVARASAGIVADPLLATHVDRTVGGQTPVVTFQILRDGRRVEIGRTTPTIAGVSGGIRHPQVREVTGGADARLTGAVQVGGTVFVRRFLDAIDTQYPEARWLALPRPGLDGRALSIYRWLNRRADDAPTIGNVDGVAYRGADNQPIGIASAGRDYAGVVAHAAVTLPRDRGSVVVAITTARSRGSLDDTHAAGIGRSDRFASPTAALNEVDGTSTSTPDLAITIFGTTRLPVLPIRVSAIYQRLSGLHYAAQRTFTAATLDVPFGVDGRTALLEPRGTRSLEPVDELSVAPGVPAAVRPTPTVRGLRRHLQRPPAPHRDGGRSARPDRRLERPAAPLRDADRRPASAARRRRRQADVLKGVAAPPGLFEPELSRGRVERNRGDRVVGDEDATAGAFFVESLDVAPAARAGLDAIDAAGVREALPCAVVRVETAGTPRRIERPLGGTARADEAAFVAAPGGELRVSATDEAGGPLPVGGGQTRQQRRGCPGEVRPQTERPDLRRTGIGRRVAVEPLPQGDGQRPGVPQTGKGQLLDLGLEEIRPAQAVRRLSTQAAHVAPVEDHIVELEDGLAGGQARRAQGVGADRSRQRHAGVDAAFDLEPGELEIDGGSEIRRRRPQAAQGGDVTRLGGCRACRRRREVHAVERLPRAPMVRRDRRSVTRAGAAAPPGPRPRRRPTAACASARSSS